MIVVILNHLIYSSSKVSLVSILVAGGVNISFWKNSIFLVATPNHSNDLNTNKLAIKSKRHRYKHILISMKSSAFQHTYHHNNKRVKKNMRLDEGKGEGK